MNEQIKQLALDAGIKFVLWDDSGRPMIANHTPEERLARFAELIVRECFSKLEQYMDDQFIDDIESELKEHFGVEL